MDHGRQAIALYPKNPRFAAELRAYAMFAGDLQAAEQAARDGARAEQAAVQAVPSSRGRRVRVVGPGGDAKGLRGHAQYRRHRRDGVDTRAGRSGDVRRSLGRCREAPRGRHRGRREVAAMRWHQANKLDRARRSSPRRRIVRRRPCARCRTRWPSRSEDAVARARGARPAPRGPAGGRAGDRVEISASSFSLGAARTAPSSRARLRGPRGASSKPRTRSIALRSSPTSGSGGSCSVSPTWKAPSIHSAQAELELAEKRRGEADRRLSRRRAVVPVSRAAAVLAGSSAGRPRPGEPRGVRELPQVSGAAPGECARSSGRRRAQAPRGALVGPLNSLSTNPGQRRSSLAAQGCVVNRSCTVVGNTFPATSVVVVDA